MTKIFNWSASLGSLIDKVSGTKGVLTSGEFTKTEKGMAMLFDATNTKIEYSESISGTYTLYAWVKPSNNGLGRYIYDGRASGGTGYAYLDSIDMYESSGTVDVYVNNVSSITPLFNEWQLVIFQQVTFDDTEQVLGLRNTGAQGWEGHIAKVGIINKSTLSSQERATLYKQFLNSFPLGQQKVNPIEYNVNKPTDLSGTTGLVASYNFITS